MNRYTPLMILLLATLLLTSCDALGVKSKIIKCDDPKALELTANLIRLNSGMRDPLFGLPVNPIADHSLATTEMILNQGIDKEIGKTSCVASFIFIDKRAEATNRSCKYVSRTKYDIQYDTTGQLIATIPQVGALSCTKFTRDEIEIHNREWNSPDAQVERGDRLYSGVGVTKDFKAAAYWYREAASQGSAQAQHNLAIMYSLGQGVNRDDAEALWWTGKAAEQGHSDGQFELGERYRLAHGVERSVELAIKWYRLAARQDHRQAQYRVGMLLCCEVTKPVEDKIEAYKWIVLSGDTGGDSPARATLQELEKQLSRSELRKAQNEVLEWRESRK